jgi:uncharacterized protein (DUF1697 family)
MPQKIAILRGINVGGKRKLPMADLRALFEKMGFLNILTYIQSGNVLFDVEGDSDDSELSKRIEKEIKNEFGYDVPVIIRTAFDLEKVIKHNPFYNEGIDISSLHLTFLNEGPAMENIRETESYQSDPDRFALVGKEVFIYCEGKYHETKLSNTFFEKKLKVRATTRNWKTVLALYELSRKM